MVLFLKVLAPLLLEPLASLFRAFARQTRHWPNDVKVVLRKDRFTAYKHNFYDSEIIHEQIHIDIDINFIKSGNHMFSQRNPY